MGVQELVLGLLDRRSLGCMAACCIALRDMAHAAARMIRVPNAANGRDLANIGLGRFTHARRLSFSGDYASLHPSCLPAFLHTRLVASPLPCHPFLSELCLRGLRLPQPLPLALIQSLPEVWPHLQRLELVDTRLNCPLSCTKREALEAVLGQLFEIEGSPAQPGSLVQLVDEHEQRLDRNLLVSLEVCQAAARLPRLRHLVLRGHIFLHLHNLAVMTLSACTALETLELDVPSSGPLVTGHSVRRLPPSLRMFTLGVQALHAAAALPPHLPTASFRLEVRPVPGVDPDNVFFRPLMQHGTWETLPRMPNLASLSFHSAAPDMDPTELQPELLSEWLSMQEHDAQILARVLTQAPRLLRLDVSGVGPRLFELLASAVDQTPTESLALSCHSSVDPMALMHKQIRAELSLTLRGVTVADLVTLCGDDKRGLLEKGRDGATGSSGSSSGGGPQQAEAQQQEAGARRVSVRQQQQQEQRQQQRQQKQQQGQGQTRGSPGGAAAATAKVSKKQKKAEAAAAAEQLRRLQVEQHRREQEERRQQQRALLQQQLEAGRWHKSGAPRLANLVHLHLQRSHEVSDEHVAAALSSCRSIRSVQLTTCRDITCQVVVAVAKLRRAIKLRCVSCRQVSSDGWCAAACETRSLPGVVVLDLGLPSYEDAACEVHFGP